MNRQKKINLLTEKLDSIDKVKASIKSETDKLAKEADDAQKLPPEEHTRIMNDLLEKSAILEGRSKELQKREAKCTKEINKLTGT